jgi:hypothetical protein
MAGGHGQNQVVRFLRSDNALIPLIDFLFASGLDHKPEGDVSAAMLRYLYMSFFLQLFMLGYPSTVVADALDHMESVKLIRRSRASQGVRLYQFGSFEADP